MRAHSLEMKLGAAGQYYGEIDSTAKVHLHQCSSVVSTGGAGGHGAAAKL